MQTTDEAADTRFPYAPIPHEVHVLAPVVNELYAPAAHAVHTNEVLETLELL